MYAEGTESFRLYNTWSVPHGAPLAKMATPLTWNSNVLPSWAAARPSGSWSRRMLRRPTVTSLLMLLLLLLDDARCG